MFHLVASILAISDSITDLVLLDAPSVLADELVKPAVDIAALFVLALRTVVAFVASSFRGDALSVVALETLGPAGEPPVRDAMRQSEKRRQQISCTQCTDTKCTCTIRHTTQDCKDKKHLYGHSSVSSDPSQQSICLSQSFDPSIQRPVRLQRN